MENWTLTQQICPDRQSPGGFHWGSSRWKTRVFSASRELLRLVLWTPLWILPIPLVSVETGGMCKTNGSQNASTPRAWSCLWREKKASVLALSCFAKRSTLGQPQLLGIVSNNSWFRDHSASLISLLLRSARVFPKPFRWAVEREAKLYSAHLRIWWAS